MWGHLKMKLLLAMCFLSMISISACNAIHSQQLQMRVCKGKKFVTSKILDVRWAESDMMCVRECKRNSHCLSANFDAKNGTCQLLCEEVKHLDCNALTKNEQTTFLSVIPDTPCYFRQKYDGSNCTCEEGFSGVFCENPPKDCIEYPGFPPGTKNIYLTGMCSPTPIFCAMQTTPVFELPGSGLKKYPNADWTEYKSGFGEPLDEHWIGNEKLYKLVVGSGYRYEFQLSIELEEHTHLYATYPEFKMGNEAEDYIIHFDPPILPPDFPTGYLKDGAIFRTQSRNENGCVRKYGMPFWYSKICDTPPTLNGWLSMLNNKTYKVINLTTKLVAQPK